MQLRDVLFVGGDVKRLASVKVRCRDIAARLGCDVYYRPRSAGELPRRYKAFILIKPAFSAAEIQELGRRSLVIWDVLDDNPPADGVAAYICSTRHAQRHFPSAGASFVIPHHHCNIERVRLNPSPANVGYVGSRHWYPWIKGISHSTCFVEGMSRTQVVSAYAKLGIVLNVRQLQPRCAGLRIPAGCQRPKPAIHVKLNSGIKLINCLGFGLPSISSYEPAYAEIAPECTIFGAPHQYRRLLRTLQENPSSYAALRHRCLAKADAYHVDNIAKQYRSLIKRL